MSSAILKPLLSSKKLNLINNVENSFVFQKDLALQQIILDDKIKSDSTFLSIISGSLVQKGIYLQTTGFLSSISETNEIIKVLNTKEGN